MKHNDGATLNLASANGLGQSDVEVVEVVFLQVNSSDKPSGSLTRFDSATLTELTRRLDPFDR